MDKQGNVGQLDLTYKIESDYCMQRVVRQKTRREEFLNVLRNKKLYENKLPLFASFKSATSIKKSSEIVTNQPVALDK